ncbi:MAG: TRAP transporter substrate-binding protein [Firmicutes bacterium]|nr:TRAP transporter substrate-binding protein [Bacillota bacterium]
MKLSKKILLSIVFVLGLALLAGCGGNKGGDTAAKQTMKPVTLKFADFFPPTHPASVKMMQHWAKRVEEVTNGLVKVQYYPAGTLLKSGDIYEGVASGVADVGHDVSGYNIGRLPVLNAMYVGGIQYKGNKTSCYVARDLIKELKPKELEDTQLMFVYGISPGVLMTTKPVRTLEDLQGMQIRASGANVDTLKALGAVPVGITIAETYDSMAKGVVDGALLPAEPLKAFKLGEVTKYVTQADMLYNTVHYVTMNKNVWNSFPKDIQDAINKVNDEVFEIALDLWEGKDGLSKAGLDFAVEKGGQIITLSDQESARWMEKLKPLRDDYAKVLDSKGIDGKAVMNRIVELAEKYNNQFYKK